MNSIKLFKITDKGHEFLLKIASQDAIESDVDLSLANALSIIKYSMCGDLYHWVLTPGEDEYCVTPLLLEALLARSLIEKVSKEETLLYEAEMAARTASFRAMMKGREERHRMGFDPYGEEE